MAASSTGHAQSQRPTKSFLGCWTCRRRGVRCDEQRPQCRRCVESGRECEGFDIRLTWRNFSPCQISLQRGVDVDNDNDNDIEDSTGHNDAAPGSSRRRYIPSWVSSVSTFAAYNSDALNEAIKAVQCNIQGTDAFYEGPFGVFRIQPPSGLDMVGIRSAFDEFGQRVDAEGANGSDASNRTANEPNTNGQHENALNTNGQNAIDQSLDSQHAAYIGLHENSDDEHVDEPIYCLSSSVISQRQPDLLLTQILPKSLRTPIISDIEDSNEQLVAEESMATASPAFSASAGSFNQSATASMTTQSDSISPGEIEGAKADAPARKALFHFWKRYVSHLMVSIPGDNPYLTSITPMAESGDHQSDPACFALYHSILAVAAFSRAALIPDKDRYITLGTSYYDQTLTALASCFLREPVNNNEAIVLASIVMTGLVDVFRPMAASSANWRLHSQAGWEWMRSRDLMSSDDPTVSILASMVLMPAILGISRRDSTIDFFDPLLVAEGNSHGTYRLKYPCFNEYYHLDRLFGIPKRILECILAVNAIVQRCSPVSDDEINALGYDIVASDPGLSENMYCYRDSEDDLRTHLRYVFYYATEIHFERSVLRSPVEDVSWIVDQSTPHLEALLSDQQSPRGPCLLWPIFIIGAECTEVRVQRIIMTFFSLDSLKMAENYGQARILLTEIWRRRKISAARSSLSWADVMDDMNFDILLV